MDNDDKPIGKILSRREVLSVLGLGSLAGVGGLLNLRKPLHRTRRCPRASCARPSRKGPTLWIPS